MSLRDRIQSRRIRRETRGMDQKQQWDRAVRRLNESAQERPAREDQAADRTRRESGWEGGPDAYRPRKPPERAARVPLDVVGRPERPQRGHAR